MKNKIDEREFCLIPEGERKRVDGNEQAQGTWPDYHLWWKLFMELKWVLLLKEY